ncbi:hypothetical protein ACH4FX_14400 [Streptomyces sp. NPDC018019]|uniref:hypothetical protein n=1 Tax=Streptomyces sp. NPDC018019 TaxID=3365030 RepID=UPI003799BC63
MISVGVGVNFSRPGQGGVTAMARCGIPTRPTAGRRGAARSEPSTVVREVARHATANLNGAKQSTAAQAADTARHLAFVG